MLTHLDDPSGIWRNGLAFDPRRKYGGYSYEVRGGVAVELLRALVCVLLCRGKSTHAVCVATESVGVTRPTALPPEQSRQDVVLMPAARAMAAAAKPDTAVEFVLAGEMGRSMFGFPQ